ncbi:hypothetical protein O2W14_00215 [Modestobacter sp. VKM Ac-2986]|uniref:DUF7507 domain-containing protein n=1 Tax=Modestobacter sp. VKM Ac-2986 TaxID=3004140 RepID=UPI0022AA7C8C|nr:hypothetical protein [Modestobacter sp. VKM Ac-2986]MCZ2827255.1 hypothetical protein [Modestobacter sp. VKM Ac-2986]
MALADGGFELPVIPDNSFAFLPENQVPGWRTTATDGLIELWRAPFQGVPAAAGSQFAELNATQPSTLYQDLPTTPGQTLRWELAHRGRSGTDVMSVVLGAPSGLLTGQGNLSDGRTAWGVHSGTYTVPAGQTTTRFGFRAVTSAGGNPSVGNFLDNISFGTGPCVVATTTATTRYGGPTANVGELLTYTVSAANAGGNPARNAVVTDVLPAGVTFVPGSIRAITASATEVRSDAAGDDQGEYDAATRTVRVRVGLGSTATAGGVIRPDDNRSISYQVRVDTASAESTITDDATVSFDDDLAGQRRTSTSNQVVTRVDPAADLAVTATQVTRPLVAGRTAEYTVALVNNGPSTEPDARVTATLPELDGATVSTADGTCTLSGQTVTCDYDTLAVAQSRSLTITGTVPAGAAPGAQYAFLTATASGTFDQVAGNNVRTTSDTVTTSADLGVTLNSSGGAIAGQDVTYTSVVTNEGPSVARGVRLVDPLPVGASFRSASVDGTPVSCVVDPGTGTVECPLPDLGPGASATVEMVVRLSASGSDVVDNSVVVLAETPDPDVTDNNASYADPVGERADLAVALDLHTAVPGRVRPGETFTFTLAVTNLGPSTAQHVSFLSVLPPGIDITDVAGVPCSTTTSGCTIPEIAVDGTETLTGTAAVRPTAPAGLASATATAVSPVQDVEPRNDTATVSLEVYLEADLSVTQEAADPRGPDLVAGEPVHAVVTVHNAGRTRADGVVLRMPVPTGQPVPELGAGGGTCHYEGSVVGGVSADGAVVVCTLETLAVGADWTVTSDTVLRASSKDDRFTRTRRVSAASPDPDTGDNVHVLDRPQVRRSDIDVRMTASAQRVVQTQSVSFQVVVTNRGPSDARDLLLRNAPHPGVLVTSGAPSSGAYSAANGSWRVPYLAVGDEVTLDVVGTVQSADPVVDEALFLSAEDADPVRGNDTASVTVDVVPAARSLTVTPLSTVAAPADAAGVRSGDGIAYRYLVANDGNVEMTGVEVTDQLVGAATCPQSSLAPGTAMTCTALATHRVTQGEFDAGQGVVSAATVTGSAPDSTTPLAFGPVVATVPVGPATPALTAVAVAHRPGVGPRDALVDGQSVLWSVYVTNTGDVTLSDLTVEALVSPAAVCARTSLPPGASTTCTAAAYSVTPADVTAGVLEYRPTVTAAEPRGGPRASASSWVSSPSDPAPALETAVSRVPGGAALPDVGDVVQWRHRVTNVGNVGVRDVAVVDADGGPTACAAALLQPGASVLCPVQVTHVVTEADLLAGRVTHTATARGDAAGTSVESLPDTASVLLAAVRAEIGMTTTVTTASGTDPVEAVRPGDELLYRFLVRNNGNVRLTSLEVRDSAGVPTTCQAVTLARGETTTCAVSAPYRVTAEDARTGRLVRSATAAADPPAGSGALLASHWAEVAVTVVPPDPVPAPGDTAPPVGPPVAPPVPLPDPAVPSAPAPVPAPSIDVLAPVAAPADQETPAAGAAGGTPATGAPGGTPAAAGSGSTPTVPPAALASTGTDVGPPLVLGALSVLLGSLLLLLVLARRRVVSRRW